MIAAVWRLWGERLDRWCQYLPNWAAKSDRRARGHPPGD